MKRYINTLTAACTVAALLTCTVHTAAQFVNTKRQESPLNWQNLSFDEDGFYGAGINKAHSLLEGRKPGKVVTVAIIGPGIDIEHEDLQTSIWLNPKEKPNGKDSNKNGKTDDLNGWNFLGNQHGEVVEKAMSLGDREFLRLKDKYGQLQTDSVKYYIPNEDESALITVAAPENIEEYKYFITEVRKASTLAQVHGGVEMLKAVRIYGRQLYNELKAKYPEKDDFTIEDISALPYEHNNLKAVSLALLQPAFMAVKEKTLNNVINYMENIQKKVMLENLEKALSEVNPNDREFTGDNPYDIKDTKYGNNILLTENAGRGTLYAGIIAAQRSNGTGIDGIAGNACVMTLRVETTPGESLPKDMTLAIRYAVDNGACIIQLPCPGMLTPFGKQSQWVNDALRYAESKNVLVIQPVSDSSYDNDETPFFPNRNISSSQMLSNVITVAASDTNGNPLPETNFGSTSLDLYAPGKDIYSTYISDTYRTESGSDMAASVVAGTAALLKSYFPGLTAKELREIIINNVTDRSGAEVEKQVMIRTHTVYRRNKDLYLFDDLCTSAGILNAAKAIEAALKTTK